MTFKTIKLRWAKKLMLAKYFVILTDKESVIAIDGADPNSFTDLLALSSQQAEIEMFYNKLGSLIKDHKMAVNKLTGAKNESSKRTRRSATKPKSVATRVRGNKAKKA